MNNLPERMAIGHSKEQQLIKLIEELGECITAASRLYAICYSNPINHKDSLSKRSKNIYAKQDQLIEEIIDVEFLFAQMRYYFDGFEEAKKKNDEEIERRFFNA